MFDKLLSEILLDYEKELLLFSTPESKRFIRSLDRAVINNKPLALNYYFQGNKPVLAMWSKKLVDLGLIKTTIKPKWISAEINMEGLTTYLPTSTIEETRQVALLNRFSLKSAKADDILLTKSGHDYYESGLQRSGFKKCSQTPFKLDVVALQDNFYEIRDELLEGLEKAKSESKYKWTRYTDDKFNYSTLVEQVMTKYIALDGTYNLEDVYADGRGRAIFKALKRVLNPVGSKLGRSLVVIPASHSIVITKDDKQALDDIYLFIAELVGGKAGITPAQKVLRGKKYTILQTTVDDLADNIWLQRIYKLLSVFKSAGSVCWNIPLEVDASMSIAQIAGTILGDRRLLQRTSAIGNLFNDAWNVDGVPRVAVKTVGTPTFYGSSEAPRKLLKTKKIKLADAELVALIKTFKDSDLALLTQFKDAVISNQNITTPTYTYDVWEDCFEIKVNKHKPANTKLNITTAWDSNLNKYKTSITREVEYVPDYKSFKLYHFTCLVHNLDSQIMNKIANFGYNWMIPIHDAVLCLPGVATNVRNKYISLIEDLYNDRHSVLKQFRQSIGATSLKADIDFMKLYQATVQLLDTDSFSNTAMK